MSINKTFEKSAEEKIQKLKDPIKFYNAYGAKNEKLLEDYFRKNGIEGDFDANLDKITNKKAKELKELCQESQKQIAVLDELSSFKRW